MYTRAYLDTLNKQSELEREWEAIEWINMENMKIAEAEQMKKEMLIEA